MDEKDRLVLAGVKWEPKLDNVACQTGEGVIRGWGPWSKEGMEWNQWLKGVILYRSDIVYKGVEGEGRGCKRLRIEK